ncbi:Protease HtpX [Actinomadura sp. RB99]|uniref:M56 family metallopeptidase n=1 Tax=Actinomadura sp. RB99 TaxID=2691577 RepID=UPI0016845755|nr:M56 family metallopeptidase [Actinomadura sp. RB99]MBD2892359.1 Protease HtpX [Actinomadura sp. RB99]
MTRRVAETGNRAFWTLVGASSALRTAAFHGVCCLAMVVMAAVRDGGIAALWTSRLDLLPGVLVLVITGIGMAKGAWSLGRSLRHTSRFVRTVRRRRIPAPAELQAAADRTGIGARIRVVAASRPFALTYGLHRPRVLVSTGLLEALSEDELDAVLVHEHAHVRNHDPLKNLFARVIPARHFYLPGMAWLRQRFTMGRELAADRSAVAHRGTAALAGSLLKVSEGPAWVRSVPAAAMASDELLAVRIVQLETGMEPPMPKAGRKARAAAAAVALAFVTACGWSAFVIAHSMPGCK